MVDSSLVAGCARSISTDHMRATIRPISGVGKLLASERKRRAREIVAASGAD